MTSTDLFRTRYAAAAAVVAASISAVAAGGVVINGSITSTDFPAIDSSGTFYYDLYEISNTTGGDILVSVSLAAGDSEPLGTPWMAYWTSQVLPQYDWESPVDIYGLIAEVASNSQFLALTPFVLPAGATYQIAVSPQFYLEGGGYLNAYSLEIEGDGVTVTQVPAPGVGALLLLSGVVGSRRRAK